MGVIFRSAGESVEQWFQRFFSRLKLERLGGLSLDEWIVVFEGCDRVGKRFCTWSGGMRGGVSFLGDFPKSTAFPVTAGMSEGDFVVPDDFVVEIGNVEGSIVPHAHVNGAEPEVVACDKITLFNGHRGASSEFNSVMVDS